MASPRAGGIVQEAFGGRVLGVQAGGAWGPWRQENGLDRRAEPPDRGSLSLIAHSQPGVEHPCSLPLRRASELAKTRMPFRKLRPARPWPFGLEPSDTHLPHLQAVLPVRRHRD